MPGVCVRLPVLRFTRLVLPLSLSVQVVLSADPAWWYPHLKAHPAPRRASPALACDFADASMSVTVMAGSLDTHVVVQSVEAQVRLLSCVLTGMSLECCLCVRACVWAGRGERGGGMGEGGGLAFRSIVSMAKMAKRLVARSDRGEGAEGCGSDTPAVPVGHRYVGLWCFTAYGGSV